MDELSSRLAAYAAAAEPNELPHGVVRAASLHLVDSLACAIPAYRCETAEIARRLAKSPAPERYPGRILGFGG
jgi:2-methylcitrate dehydratase PrpD